MIVKKFSMECERMVEQVLLTFGNTSHCEEDFLVVSSLSRNSIREEHHRSCRSIGGPGQRADQAECRILVHHQNHCIPPNFMVTNSIDIALKVPRLSFEFCSIQRHPQTSSQCKSASVNQSYYDDASSSKFHHTIYRIKKISAQNSWGSNRFLWLHFRTGTSFVWVSDQALSHLNAVTKGAAVNRFRWLLARIEENPPSLTHSLTHSSRRYQSATANSFQDENKLGKRRVRTV